MLAPRQNDLRLVTLLTWHWHYADVLVEVIGRVERLTRVRHRARVPVADALIEVLLG